MVERSLSEQARTRLRRIEGQVRGLQRMLDRLDEGSEGAQALRRQVQELLDQEKTHPQIADELGISRQRVADIAKGRAEPEGEPCDNLLTQVLAVRAAIEQVGLLIMELHLECCVLDGVPIDEERLRELRDSLKHWSSLSPA